jgi:hypothetical protein
MSANLKPSCYNWASVVQGDTFPAIVFAASGTSTDLARVRVTVKDKDGNAKLTLDSNTSGVTLNDTTAGSWNYTVGPVSAANTTSIAAGTHSYDLETTDVGGVVRTHFHGFWEILPQITS